MLPVLRHSRAALICGSRWTAANNRLAFHAGVPLPSIQVKMPSLSPTMTEGTIVKWLKAEGEAVAAGDAVCEIQTDKTVVTMEVDEDGVLAKIIKLEDSGTIQVGSLIAVIAEGDEDWKQVAVEAASLPTDAPPKEEAAPAPAAEAKVKTEASGSAAPAASSDAAGQHETHVHMAPGVGPATNLLMAKYGIDPSVVHASGPKGIVKSDVIQYISEHHLNPVAQFAAPVGSVKKVAASAAPKEAEPPKFVFKPSSGYTDTPLSSMRAIIAKRLSQSKSQSPHGYATLECSIDGLNKIRSDYADAGIKVSVNDLLIKAVGTTLQYVPQLNLNTVGEDDVKIMPSIDVSVAVATPNGLITPIVKGVPNRSLEDIANAVKDLAGRARIGKLTLEEFQGGTFTISNLGMFGITEFTAIINPPQCAILAVGGGRPEIDGRSGKVFTAMRATLSFDQRFIDDALANEFMATLQKIIEQPEYMNIGLSPVVRRARQMEI